MSSTPGALPHMRCVATFSVANTLGAQATYHFGVADAAALTTQLFTGQKVTLAETLTLTSTLAVQRAVAVLENLGLDTAVAPSAIYGRSISELVRVSDAVLRFVGAGIAESFTLSDRARVGAGATIVEDLTLTDSVAPRLILRVVVTEAVDLDEAATTGAIFTAEVYEQLEIDVLHAAPDGAVSWAVNLRTGAVTEYQNFQFNSFAQHNGGYIAADGTGLFEMTGSDDDGQDLIARIRGGFMQFGGTQLSRLKEAYIATRGEGSVILRIITGDDAEYVYRVDTRNMRNTKVHIGKGMRARYFAYELETVGQDFDLDTIEFVPLVVQRRV